MGLSTNILSRDISQLKFHRFQRTYNWEVLLPIIGWIPGEVIAPLIQSVTYDDYNMEEPSAMKAGPYLKQYPNSLGSPSLSMKFLETEEGLVKTYFAFWRRLMVDSKGLWGKKKSYAKDLILLYLNSKGMPLREVKFRSAFPLTSYSAKLDYSDSSVLSVEIGFSVDRIEEGLTGTVGTPFSLDNIKLPNDFGININF